MIECGTFPDSMDELLADVQAAEDEAD